MAIVNEVRRGFYLDSVALMRISRAIAAMPGIEEVGLMIGTPANKQILREADVIDETGAAAGPGDLVIAVRAYDIDAAKAGITEATRRLDAPRRTQGDARTWHPRTLRAAQAQMPEASIALISVPGDFAAAEAMKAIRRGLDVMLFSDNVSVAEEVELKREARALGRLVMGPDCGTAIIGGVPLAFANAVPRGDIGIVGASGTGIQEISCLIARAGRGVSHAIGTGGRDLKAEVGGITTLTAIDMLEADPATAHIVIVSKPPSASVAEAVLTSVGRSRKPHTICFLGGGVLRLPGNARAAPTLEAAAEAAVGKPIVARERPALASTGKAGLIRGLYTGGTLCAEAQVVLRQAGAEVQSNVPIPGAMHLGASARSHILIDLGDDEFTRGRPHPMIEPAVRDVPLADALHDRNCAVVLLDCVLGYGGHLDPAGHLATQLRDRPAGGPVIIASLTGTMEDPQGYAEQTAKLEAVRVLVEPSNAAAARLSLRAATA